MTTKSLLLRTAAAAILTAGLVFLCVRFVDRPLASFVHEHSPVGPELWRWAPTLSDRLKYLLPAAIVCVVVWRILKKGGRLQAVFLAIAADLVVVTVLKNGLKWAFGRYWPEAWHPGDPSWIATGAYGFHPFHGGSGCASFPSGHAAVVFSVAAILWLCHPRGRWLYAAVCGGLCVALVGLNYHFLGDVLAGAVLGWITGVYTARLFHLNAPGGPP